MSKTISLWSKIFLIINIFVFGVACNFLNDSDTYCDGTDWISYKDSKCFKLIKKWTTHDEASQLCAQEFLPSDLSTPQLVSIKSSDEQQFLTKYVFELNDVQINVWIGAKRANSSGKFIWNDGSEVQFSNWINRNFPTGKLERKCVTMQSSLTRKLYLQETQSIEGKWRDVTCEQPNYVLCEKMQKWPFSRLQFTLIDQRSEFDGMRTKLGDAVKEISVMKDELSVAKGELSQAKQSLSQASIRQGFSDAKLEDAKKNLIPIGFVYVQLPNELRPNEIWPWLVWSDITSGYEPVYLRVYSERTVPFGKTKIRVSSNVAMRVWKRTA